ncbi:MAG: hypothetical protein ACRDUV_09205 [Pseudonocardiaceae bacterium]
MSDTVSFAELDGQHVELLPARTVLSMFIAGDGGIGKDGTDAVGKIGVNFLGFPVIPGSGNAFGGHGASANG